MSAEAATSYRGWTYFPRRDSRLVWVVEFRAPFPRMTPSFYYGNPFRAFTEKRAVAKFKRYVDKDIAWRVQRKAKSEALGHRGPSMLAPEEIA